MTPMRRLRNMALAALLFGLGSAEARQLKITPRIGYLRQGSPISVKSEDDAFRQGLRDLEHHWL
jgi:hypothetical protein